MEKNTIKLSLRKSINFKLEKAVCNHGFFMMAPNRWLPDEKSIVRPLSIIDKSTNTTVTVTVSINQPVGKDHLVINYHIHDGINISKRDISKSIQDQVSRMLHISERDEMQLVEFYKVHPQAKEEGFGRIIRSPTIFEDIVKSVLLNNVQWSRSLRMAQELCDLQFTLSKKKKKKKKKYQVKRSATSNNFTPTYVVKGGNFPSPEEIASLDEEFLLKYCTLGYRGSLILELASEFIYGNLAEYIERETNEEELMKKLMNIKGVGLFTAANIMMCLGFYGYIPSDSETIKHLQEVHGQKTITKVNQIPQVIAEIYDKYSPYQCLAYWRERVQYYERKMGKLSDLPHEQYGNVVTPKMTKT